MSVTLSRSKVNPQQWKPHSIIATIKVGRVNTGLARTQPNIEKATSCKYHDKNLDYPRGSYQDF